MGEKDLSASQTIEYDPEAYVKPDQAQEAANMLADYLDGNGLEPAARVVRSIQQVLAARSTDYSSDEMYGAQVSYVDSDGNTFAGFVMEPHVTEMPTEKAWDPNKQEYVDPAEYPMGTVQLVYFPEGVPGDDVFFDRLDNLDSATSIPPATHPDDTLCYFPGWDYARQRQSE